MSDHTLGESQFLTLQDGRKLHYRTAGSGSPTVVFEGGMGFSSAIWGRVQPTVAERTHTVVYDRAGAGKSDWDSADRTIDRMSDDLRQLLAVLPGPLILVGYSWGGPIVRKVTLRDGADVLALVLINQTDEKNLAYVRLARKRSRLVRLWLLWFMHTKGLRSASWSVIRHMPADCRREIIFRDLLVRGVRLFAAEGKQFLSGLMAMRKEDDRFAGIEVTVIAGGNEDTRQNPYSTGMVAAQRKTAEVVDRGRLVTAHKSAHYVPLTEPDIVIEEILRLVNQHRNP